MSLPVFSAVGVLDLTLSPSSELLDSKESTIIFTISLINKGRTVAASAENMFKLNISLSANNDPVIVFRESALVATFEGLDSPDRMSEFENGDIWEYTNATAKLTMSTSDCVGKCSHLMVISSQYDQCATMSDFQLVFYFFFY